MKRHGCLIVATLSALIAAPTLGQYLSERTTHLFQQRTRADMTKSRILGALLYTDLTVQFNETPAREAIDYLKDALSINIRGRYSDDRTGTGIDPETPISLDVTNQPALTVLEIILDQCSDDLATTTWQLRNGFVEVGTKDRLAASQQIRYYPIRDLLFESPQYDNAPDLDLNSALNQSQNSGAGGGGRGSGGGGIGSGGGNIISDPEDDPEMPNELERAKAIVELITRIVEPEGWLAAGGDWGSIRYHQGALIIRAPDFMQREINGYPFPARPALRGVSQRITHESRYVTFSGRRSQIEIVGIDSTPFGNATGDGS